MPQRRLPTGLRLLHAANARLDVPIRGVGPVAGPIRRSLEDASLVAFDRLVEQAIDREVDAVLLGGNSFRIADRSLRARLRVEQGLAMLSEAGIATVASCGPLDPPSAWYDLALPEDVSILTDRDPDAELTIRDETVLVSRIAGRGAITLLPPGEPFDGHCESEYVGLADGCRATAEQDRSTVHDPGPLCPLTPSDIGTHGASLVETHRGGVRISPLDLSPVVAGSETIAIDGETDIESLAELMQEQMVERDGLGEEVAEVITWSFDGAGPVLGDLSLDGTWDDLIELIDEAGGSRLHLLRREPAASRPDDIAALLADELTGHFDQTDLAIDEVIESVNHAALRRRIDEAAVRDRIEPRVRELARVAIGPNCPALWDGEAA